MDGSGGIYDGQGSFYRTMDNRKRSKREYMGFQERQRLRVQEQHVYEVAESSRGKAGYSKSQIVMIAGGVHGSTRSGLLVGKTGGWQCCATNQ
jgi:hypothetical protein